MVSVGMRLGVGGSKVTEPGLLRLNPAMMDPEACYPVLTGRGMGVKDPPPCCTPMSH